MKNFFNTEAWKWIRTFLEIALICIIVLAISFCFRALGFAEEYTEAYIICTPGDYVNIRSLPKIRSEVVGYLSAEDQIVLDGKERNGFLHIVNVSNELGEGWVFSGYVVYDKPELINDYYYICSRGRLAARKNVNGKRTRWLKPLATVKVYYMSDDWSLTNCGYVKTQYLEWEGETT